MTVSEVKREADRRWRAANKEYKAEQNRQWAAANPEKIKVQTRCRAEHPGPEREREVISGVVGFRA